MININGRPVEVNYYPDGIPRLNFNVLLPSNSVDIEWLYEPNEEMLLYYIVNHIRSLDKNQEINLYLPYIPHSRADRVEEKSEVFILKYFTNFINSLNFKNVIVRDAHSYVSLGLIDRVMSEDLFTKINHLISKYLHKDKDIVFYPDLGSYKKYSKSIKFPCAYGIKDRDWDTGKILKLDIIWEQPKTSFNVLIIDDISSYGTTFTKSAEKLKSIGADKIYLYITHAENNILKGDVIKCGLFKKIFTTKSIFTDQHELIEVL